MDDRLKEMFGIDENIIILPDSNFIKRIGDDGEIVKYKVCNAVVEIPIVMENNFLEVMKGKERNLIVLCFRNGNWERMYIHNGIRTSFINKYGVENEIPKMMVGMDIDEFRMKYPHLDSSCSSYLRYEDDKYIFNIDEFADSMHAVHEMAEGCDKILRELNDLFKRAMERD